MKCKNCNINDAIKYSKYSNGNFCSKRCANTYSTKNDNYIEMKICKCIICGDDVYVNKRTTTNKCLCVECKKVKSDSICKICGLKKSIHRKDVCNKIQLFNGLSKYFGMDLSKIGSVEIYKEFDAIIMKIKEMYIDNEMSLSDIQNITGHRNNRNLYQLVKATGIPIRKLSEAVSLNFKNGKQIPPTNPKYKHGWHTTWNGKKVFYRSSYELDYCNILDSNKIDYYMENLRILYWDSQMNKYRVAIPDFNIPEKNLIVEIKSQYTYDETNMKDKISEYKKLGYDVKLILDGIEIL